jgi:hypothetical protein
MIEEILLALMLFATVVGLASRPLGRFRAVIVGAVVAWLALAASKAVHPRGDFVSEAATVGRPIRIPVDDYVSSTTCKACHPHQYRTWDDSYHQSMTQLASRESVLGEVPATINYGGEKYHLAWKDDEFWIDIPNPDPRPSAAEPRIRRQVLMTTGSHHEQIYWYASGETRKLVIMPFAWKISDARWVPRDAVFLLPPEEQQVHDVGQWNKTCIKCHSTQGNPGLDLAALPEMRLETHAVEFGIGCESCHGPARDHVERNRIPSRRYGMHFDAAPDETIVNPANLSHRRSAQVCGQCHGITIFNDEETQRNWWTSSFAFRPGEEFSEADRFHVKRREKLDHKGVMHLLTQLPYFWADTYWSDGMVRINGREYNGLLDTPCFQRGAMSCVSCHVLHQAADDPRPVAEWADDQLKPRMRTSEACLQCHEPYRDDIAAHTYHAPDSAGSNCMNCHMSHTAYGLLKMTRSHRVDSPSVRTSMETGRPTACNQCHLDRTLQWTAEHLERWYGHEVPELNEDERTIASSVLLALRGDAGQRALMAWSMGWPPALEASGTGWQAAYLSQLLLDPYDAVRYVAHKSLTAHPGYADLEFNYVAPKQHWTAAVRKAQEIWMSSAESRATGDEILVAPDGSVNREIVARLLKQRNNRRVNFQE